MDEGQVLPALTVELHRPFDGNARQLFRDRVVGEGDPSVALTISREKWLRLGRPTRVRLVIETVQVADAPDDSREHWVPSDDALATVLDAVPYDVATTRQAIEDATGISAATVRRSLAVLEARGLVRNVSHARPHKFLRERVKPKALPADDVLVFDPADGDLRELDAWAPASKASP